MKTLIPRITVSLCHPFWEIQTLAPVNELRLHLWLPLFHFSIYVVQFIHLCGSFYSFILFILLMCAFISSFLAFVSSFYDFHFFLLYCCFLSFIMCISMLYSITCIMDSQIVMTPYWILIYVNYELKHTFFKVLMFVVIDS